MGFFSFHKYKVMAVGKNKGLSKGGKKGAKKKIIDLFTRKDWYDIKAPSIFKVRDVGKTLRVKGSIIFFLAPFLPPLERPSFWAFLPPFRPLFLPTAITLYLWKEKAPC